MSWLELTSGNLRRGEHSVAVDVTKAVHVVRAHRHSHLRAKAGGGSRESASRESSPNGALYTDKPTPRELSCVSLLEVVRA